MDSLQSLHLAQPPAPCTKGVSALDMVASNGRALAYYTELGKRTFLELGKDALLCACTFLKYCALTPLAGSGEAESTGLTRYSFRNAPINNFGMFWGWSGRLNKVTFKKCTLNTNSKNYCCDLAGKKPH